MHNLTQGFLSPIREKVFEDIDLDLQIRENYLNIYFKVNSLLKLDEITPQKYKITLHYKFRANCSIPDLLSSPETVSAFLQAVPLIKENVLQHKSSIETEFEQMIIRANNDEPRNSSEYFIVDRQHTEGEYGRFDLTRIYWPRNKRRKGDIIPLCLMEIKYALNPDISEVQEQIRRYYDSIAVNPSAIAEETEVIFKQKLELGLFDHQPLNRPEAMKTLRVSRSLSHFQFIVILIDYNPFSSKFNPETLKNLQFANQIRVLKTGFAMWVCYLEQLSLPFFRRSFSKT